MALGAYIPRIEDPGKRRPARTQTTLHTAIENVALLGFGTVGHAVADLLCRSHEPKLRLTHVFNRNVERKRGAWVPDDVQWTENYQEVLKSNADVVVELMGGLEPAHECIRQALQSGKSVVTANKHVIAKYGLELLDLARKNGVHLEYGAAVAGAVPVLAALRYGFTGDRLFRVRGILNGTCNFILSNMEANGTTLAAALAEAQRLGYAESDPSDDVNGLDAACKLAIVARHGLHADLNAFEVPRQSIVDVQSEDFHCARQLGCTIRQISIAELHGETLQAAVGPALISLKSPLALSVDNQNALIVSGENSGDSLLAGRGAGGPATAVAVVSDLLSIAAASSVNGLSAVKRYAKTELNAARYLRVRHRRGDLPGALTSILDRHEIRTQSRVQTLDKNDPVTAFALETCSTAAIEAVVSETAKLDGISQAPLCLPMLCRVRGEAFAPLLNFD
ncbi:MAG TPA: homoserine dehydrogenase [Terriglobales bacterium]|nr:homoserine dehydrogenase [Terriglobales bacterium]